MVSQKCLHVALWMGRRWPGYVLFWISNPETCASGLHTIVSTSRLGVCDFVVMEWCSKPFWRNTFPCKIKPVLTTRKPGFLVNACKHQAQQEGRMMRRLEAYELCKEAILRGKRPEGIWREFIKESKYELFD